MNMTRCENWIAVLDDLGIKSEVCNLGDYRYCVLVNSESHKKLVAIDKLFTTFTHDLIVRVRSGIVTLTPQCIIVERELDLPGMCECGHGPEYHKVTQYPCSDSILHCFHMDMKSDCQCIRYRESLS